MLSVATGVLTRESPVEPLVKASLNLLVVMEPVGVLNVTSSV
jgi:hypothetical protein